MSRITIIASVLAAAMLLAAPGAQARVGVEVWTDRGQDAVYRPGDLMQVKVRASDDAYLLVYEIDTEGNVLVLFPFHGQSGFVEGRRTLLVPDEGSNFELAVEKATGEGFIVALASAEPFRELPWFLRPYDPRSEGVEYEGQPEDEDGVTADGRIVGDPFVAMERIRRRTVSTPGDAGSFGTGYVSYYVHERVRYPRYLCNDCHRPGRYAWWDGFDPYYTSCSVVDFRINWGWSWGPSYWFGDAPYFCYVLRTDCSPRWRHGWSGPWYSSWDGWSRWNTMWGGPLVRYKSPPPVGYIPPNKYHDPDRWRGRDAVPLPPGFLANSGGHEMRRSSLPLGRNREARGEDQGGARVTDPRQRDVRPMGQPRQDGEARGEVRGDRRERPAPAWTPRGETYRPSDRRGDRPSDRGGDRGSPSVAPKEGRGDRPAKAPPRETPRDEKRDQPPAPKQDHKGGEHRPTPPATPNGGDGAREHRGGR
jgi:hypothetical protein